VVTQVNNGHSQHAGRGAGDDGQEPADATQSLHLGRGSHDEEGSGAGPADVVEVEPETDGRSGRTGETEPRAVVE
jgi:hypothetical protein